MDPNSSSSAGTGAVDPTRNSQTRIPPPRGYALSGKIMLSAIVILFTVVLLILFIHLYVRWHVYRRNSLRRRRRRHPIVFAAGEIAAPASTAPRGLDPKVVNSLAILVFSEEDLAGEDDDAAAVAECAVCLNEFEDGEKVRVLPRCGHCFHVECIDMWFGSHSSCPLCRSPVEMESLPAGSLPTAQQCGDRSSESTSESANREVSIEIGSSASAEESTSWRKSRILAIKRFLFRDLELNRTEVDLERGEAADRAPSPPATAAD